MQILTVTLKLLLICHSFAIAVDTCGVKRPGAGLIYGGTYINPGDWPWVVPLFYRDSSKFFCSSSLISNQHLLTVAHCIIDKLKTVPTPKENIFAYVGVYNINSGSPEAVAVKHFIKRVAVHPQWDPRVVKFDSDIALLTAFNKVKFNEFVMPVCLPDRNFDIGVQVGDVVGYGKSENSKHHEVKPKVTRIPSYSNNDCFFSNYLYAQIGSPSTFCAGEIGKNPCSGDSGGGFFVKQNEYKIAGLVSSTIDRNCSANQFVLFTNVAKFIDWIQHEMTISDDSNSGSSSIYDLDEESSSQTGDRYTYADCKYESSPDGYTCHAEGLIAPDNDIQLAINNHGVHQTGRSPRDVRIMLMKKGQITHFPEMSKVVENFPNLVAFSITFTKLKHINRQLVAALKNLKYFLISDNEVEEIPPDTFYDMQNLEFIDICRNKVKVLDPYWTAAMPRLRIFKARSNLFTHIPEDVFSRNPELEEILLDKNQIAINQKDFTKMHKIKTIAMLQNPCINMEYCKNGNKDNAQCVKSLRSFTFFAFAHCNNFND